MTSRYLSVDRISEDPASKIPQKLLPQSTQENVCEQKRKNKYLLNSVHSIGSQYVIQKELRSLHCDLAHVDYGSPEDAAFLAVKAAPFESKVRLEYASHHLSLQVPCLLYSPISSLTCDYLSIMGYLPIEIGSKQNEKFVRQPALRLFAAELTESKQTIIEHIEGRDFDSHYQLTPTGIKAKRVLMMGALVEVDNVGTSGEYLRGRIVDPTGVFNVYAGHYQPEALRSLSNLTIPCFVAVVGKTNAYKPDEDTTIISIRPETIVEIDAKTRDHWVIETIAKTLERIEKSQLLETEKEKYRQICKDALTKLVYMTQEISVPLHETPEVLTPHQEENNPTNPTIEPPAIKDKDNQPDDTELKEKIFYLMMEESNKVPQKVVSYIELAEAAKKTLSIEEGVAIEAIKRLMNEGRCYEPKVGFLHPILKEEKPPDTPPASAAEKYVELGSATSMNVLLIGDQEDEEPKDKTLIASQASSPEELTKPENESSKTLRIQENKEFRTKRNNPVKRLTKKKKIERESANNNQKTLFTGAPSQE